MCGIFGASLKKGQKLNLSKVNILGIFNIQRGEDSCGVYYSGKITKGINKEANYGDFLMTTPIERGDLENEIFIGHTRKSSVGVVNLANAHPHIDDDDYVQVHNGTLRNHYELARKYNVKTTDLFVDSQILARLINTQGWSVLSEYEGFAATASTFKNSDPETLFLYHGGVINPRDSVLYEERPLYILEQKEGIYFSSLEQSLDFINENKSRYSVQQLPVNGVYSIKNGVFSKKAIYVDRANRDILKKQEEEKAAEERRKKMLVLNTNTTTKQKVYTNLALYDKPSIKKGCITMAGARYYDDTGQLCEGEYLVDRDSKILKDEKDSERVSCKMFFCRGVLMRDEKAYENFKKLVSISFGSYDDVTNFALYISKYSKYPVYNITELGEISNNVDDAIKYKWYLDEKGVSDMSFQPKLSKNVYTIQFGFLKSIKYEGAQDLFPDEEDDDKYLDSLNPSEKALVIVKDCLSRIYLKDYTSVIPEVFLNFIDNISSYMLKQYSQREPSEENIKKTTFFIIEYMVRYEISLKTFIENDKEPSDLYSDKNIALSLIGLGEDDIEEMIISPNRYCDYEWEDLIKESKGEDFYSFVYSVDTIEPFEVTDTMYDLTDKSEYFTEEEIEFDKSFSTNRDTEDFDFLYEVRNNTEKVKEQSEREKRLKELETIADHLQSIDDDEAQITANNLYKHITKERKLLK